MGAGAAARRGHAPPPRSTASARQLELISLGFTAFTVAVVLLGLSYLVCPSNTGYPLVDAVCNDSHYKYLVPLLVPVTAWFAIANWVGWQYFRFA